MSGNVLAYLNRVNSGMKEFLKYFLVFLLNYGWLHFNYWKTLPYRAVLLLFIQLTSFFFCNYTYFHTHLSLPLFVFGVLIIFTHSHLYTSPPFAHNSLNIFHSIDFCLFQSNLLKSSINILFNLFELDIVSLYIVAIRQVYSIYYF